MLIERPIIIIGPAEAQRWARAIRIAITVTERNEGYSLAPEDPLRADLADLERLATFRTARGGIPLAADESTVQTMSVSEVAEMQKVGERAIRARCQRGSLDAVKVDGDWRVFTDQFHQED